MTTIMRKGGIVHPDDARRGILNPNPLNPFLDRSPFHAREGGQSDLLREIAMRERLRNLNRPANSVPKMAAKEVAACHRQARCRHIARRATVVVHRVGGLAAVVSAPPSVASAFMVMLVTSSAWHRPLPESV